MAPLLDTYSFSLSAWNLIPYIQYRIATQRNSYHLIYSKHLRYCHLHTISSVSLYPWYTIKLIKWATTTEMEKTTQRSSTMMVGSTWSTPQSSSWCSFQINSLFLRIPTSRRNLIWRRDRVKRLNAAQLLKSGVSFENWRYTGPYTAEKDKDITESDEIVTKSHEDATRNVWVTRTLWRET